MRRILTVLALAALMAAMVVATALPAFAQASGEAGCVGQALSTAATTTPPGTVGNTISTGAQAFAPGEVGKQFSEQAQQPRDACPPLQTNR